MYYRDEFDCLLLDKKEKLNYYSQQSAFIKNKVSALNVYNEMTKETPLWLRVSFNIRDKISSLAGVKKIYGFSGDNLKEIRRDGNYIDFFKVGSGCIVTVTASVITHNFFGKLYMMPVSLTHASIVRKMLSKVGHVLN